MMRRAVFLDRDGVLNRSDVRDGKPYPPAGPGELEILAGVAQACAALRAAGFLLIVVTNQPDVARGQQRQEVVEAINAVLRARVPVDDVRVCYHDDRDDCHCRKPRPGLLVQAAHDWQVDLSDSFMVGDRWKDVDAGRRAGCATVFIDYGYAESLPSAPNYSTGSLAAAADWILSQARASRGGEL
jgi:D-glycero-D-manno-heptose 1,7-bisphosphate phosphatase